MNEEIYIEEIERLKKELAAANKRLRKLDALEAGGVDNWEWYDEAMSSLSDEDEIDE